MKATYEAVFVGSSVMPVHFDTEKCIGCHRCANACQTDILLPIDGKGKPPTVMYPGECWYCGACVMECPTGAISLSHPLMNRARFINADSLGK
ncbi:MAG: 4Fe-4S binding protein [Clostridia bacterium]|nr:4Fe-4S binding protein [Clostridia bacterium]MBR1684258.1 4Fe-4S binding protein [Clostridia bacterium]